MKTTFTTERLIASAMTRDDQYELFPIWSDPAVTKWMNIEPFETVEEARAMIDWMNDQPDAIRYTVRCEGEVLGSCGFQQMTETAAAIGYELKKARGVNGSEPNSSMRYSAWHDRRNGRTSSPESTSRTSRRFDSSNGSASRQTACAPKMEQSGTSFD